MPRSLREQYLMPELKNSANLIEKRRLGKGEEVELRMSTRGDHLRATAQLRLSRPGLSEQADRTMIDLVRDEDRLVGSAVQYFSRDQRNFALPARVVLQRQE